VGYDYESGFGLVRTDRPIDLKPMSFAIPTRWSCASEAYVAGLGGEKATLKVKVAGRREFAGYWSTCSTTPFSRSLPIRCGAVPP